VVLVNNKDLWGIIAKKITTACLLVIIVSLLVLSCVALSFPIATDKLRYLNYNTTYSKIRTECPNSAFKLLSYNENLPNTLPSTPVVKLINTPILLKLLVLPSEGYDKDRASKIIKNLSKIPDCILRKLLVSGGKIRLINGKLTDLPEYAHLKGVTPRGWEATGKTWDDLSGLGGYRDVVVKIDYCETTEGTINLELHETGHMVDCAFSNVSKSASFLELWKIEVLKVFSDTCIFDYVNEYSEEYFAETFAIYFYDYKGKEYLKEHAPLTYELLSQLGLSI